MNMENLTILSMENQEEIREWYMSHLCYTQDWQALVNLLGDENFNQQLVATFISDIIQKDFILMYTNDYISDLVTHLPLPGSQGAQNLAELLWITDEQYADDFHSLSSYYQKQEQRINRYIKKISGLSGDKTAAK